MKTYTGSPGAARHYVEADRGRADDYYLTEGTGVAERFAASPEAGVRRLEPLAGAGYEAWVGGVDPATGAPKGRLRNDDRAVRFVEVTVNGPKSWSLAAELHPDIGAAYDAAQDRAATQIIGWLAQHATTRVGPRGAQVQVPVCEIEAVTVRHYTSRAGDPHRHLHLQINARVFAEGQWRGLHTVGVRDCLDAINGIGHAAVMTDPVFRAALAAHGFTLDLQSGEVVQLAEFVGAFSARAAQIERNIDRYETAWRDANPGQEPGPAQHRSWDARAWADGRPDKVIPQSGDVLRQRWADELNALGYHPDAGGEIPVPVGAARVGELDRDRSVATVLARLAARRSGWNAADIRGEVEQLIARENLVIDAAVRTELAEDLSARILAGCVPLLARTGVPEHIRALTSRHVLDVEADLTARFAARAGTPEPRWPVGESVPSQRVVGLDAGQRAVVTLLAGERGLVVIEGAAGAGKTTTLAAVRAAIEERGHRLTVVTPTLKAAKIAAEQVGTRAGSAAWLVHQYGFRWDEHGTWTRLHVGDVDPLTGAQYAGPSAQAAPGRGDLVLVDEAGMLDHDTARALLTVTDEAGARVALVGDRHQLAAVGRGGVLDLAARWVDPEACLTLDTVRRFTRDSSDVNGASAIVADTDYAQLSLAMRTGQHPDVVFDALLARGQIRVHGSEAERQDTLADTAVAAITAGTATTVIADTREQVATLNAAIRERLVAAERVDNTHATTTTAGHRIGVGDRVVTRRNDRGLDVANRDTWTVTAVDRHGGATIAGEHGTRSLPPHYLRRHVELGYATTVHGVQGDTATAAHLAVGEHTGAASAYVAMTRGRTANTAHLVAENLDDAREQWIAVFARDRADLGPAHAARQAEHEASRYAQPRPLPAVLAELQRAWSIEQDCLERLARDETRRDLLRDIVPLRQAHDRDLPPLEHAYRQARQTAHHAALQARTAETVLAGATHDIRDSLLSAWDAQRDTARAHAQTIHAGTGRFARRSAAVTHARQHLTAWADAWRPTVPDLPTDTARLVDRLLWFENRPDLHDTLDRAARRQAEHAHPDAVAALTDAESAAQAANTAGRAYRDSTTYYDQALSRYGNLARTDHPDKVLADTEKDIEATSARLTAAQSTLADLHGEAALRVLPITRLEHERATWHQDRDTTADLARRAITRRGVDDRCAFLHSAANSPTVIAARLGRHNSRRASSPRPCRGTARRRPGGRTSWCAGDRLDRGSACTSALVRSGCASRCWPCLLSLRGLDQCA